MRHGYSGNEYGAQIGRVRFDRIEVGWAQALRSVLGGFFLWGCVIELTRLACLIPPTAQPILAEHRVCRLF